MRFSLPFLGKCYILFRTSKCTKIPNPRFYRTAERKLAEGTPNTSILPQDGVPDILFFIFE